MIKCSKYYGFNCFDYYDELNGQNYWYKLFKWLDKNAYSFALLSPKKPYVTRATFLFGVFLREIIWIAFRRVFVKHYENFPKGY
jgi:hypothetical protein